MVFNSTKERDSEANELPDACLLFDCSALVNSQRPVSNLHQANRNNSSTTWLCTTAVSGRVESMTVGEDTLSSVKCDQTKHSANCSDWLADQAISKKQLIGKSKREQPRSKRTTPTYACVFFDQASHLRASPLLLSLFLFTQIKSLLLFLFAWHKVEFNHLVSSSFDLIRAGELSNC